MRITKTAGWQAEGIEISQPLCQYAQRNSGCEIFQEPIQDLDLSSKKYDLILMSDVFRHLTSPLTTLNACINLLKRNGVIVIRDLNIERALPKRRFLASHEYDLQCLSSKTGRQFLKKPFHRYSILPITDVSFNLINF